MNTSKVHPFPISRSLDELHLFDKDAHESCRVAEVGDVGKSRLAEPLRRILVPAWAVRTMRLAHPGAILQT
jgi:hypothetical protein